MKPAPHARCMAVNTPGSTGRYRHPARRASATALAVAAVPYTAAIAVRSAPAGALTVESAAVVDTVSTNTGGTKCRQPAMAGYFCHTRAFQYPNRTFLPTNRRNDPEFAYEVRRRGLTRIRPPRARIR